jgi:predicted ATPase
VRVLRLHLTNFLSYREAILEFDDFVALVGPNASGKSNAVAALKLLRDIPSYGLPISIARRGGYDQLRHRSHGHPYDPAIRLDFQASPDAPESFYELKLGSLPGKRYEVKSERATVYSPEGGKNDFIHTKGRMRSNDFPFTSDAEGSSAAQLEEILVPPGQSAVTLGITFGSYLVSRVLSRLQTVEINPARVADLQEPSSTEHFESDGSNTAFMYETLDTKRRQALAHELSSIVPGIARIEIRRFADKLTLAFVQQTGDKSREFLAKQMSDGTLRAFSILLATHRPEPPVLLVIEEPEIAIHLGALRTLVEILQEETSRSQVLITTHSADIVDALDVDQLRVVWNSDGASYISRVAAHTKDPVHRGLVTPGELLRSDSLDPAMP